MSKDITDVDLDAYAATTVRAVTAVEELVKSPNLTGQERDLLRAVGDSLVRTTAMVAASVRRNRETDAILFGTGPAVIVEALKRKLSPGQCAQIAAALTTDL